jgi:hypothetical protein
VILSSPWRTLQATDPAGSYVALLGVVRLSGLRILPTFVRFGFHIERQLKHSQGAVGSRVGADVARLAFYHLSAWVTADAIQAFVDTAPHRIAVEQLAGRLGQTSFRYWTVRGSEFPMHFARELHRLQ